jgi:hypothetical protein
LTRTAGYNLLTAVCRYFGFDAASQLLEATGLCVPKTNSSFVVRLSSLLASSQQNLTLEFVLECLHGLVTASFEAKHLCLAYLKPWIPNLRGFSGDKEKAERLMLIFKQFSMLSVKEAEIRPAILAKFWKPLGRLPELLDMVLDVIISTATTSANGIFGEETASMSDAGGEKFGCVCWFHHPLLKTTPEKVVTLANQNSELVTGKIIARLMSAIDATGSSDPRNQLSDHKMFPTISLLARFLLMVSFDNLIDVQQYLPEVVFVCSLLFAHGDWVHRVTIHRLLINLVHSAYLLQQSTVQQDARGLQQQPQQQLLAPRRPPKKGQMTRRSSVSSRTSDRPGDSMEVVEESHVEQKSSDRVLMFLRELDDPRVAVHFGFGQHLSLSPFSNPSELKRKGPPARVPLESALPVSVS